MLIIPFLYFLIIILIYLKVCKRSLEINVLDLKTGKISIIEVDEIIETFNTHIDDWDEGYNKAVRINGTKKEIYKVKLKYEDKLIYTKEK